MWSDRKTFRTQFAPVFTAHLRRILIPDGSRTKREHISMTKPTQVDIYSGLKCWACLMSAGHVESVWTRVHIWKGLYQGRWCHMLPVWFILAWSLYGGFRDLSISWELPQTLGTERHSITDKKLMSLSSLISTRAPENGHHQLRAWFSVYSHYAGLL